MMKRISIFMSFRRWLEAQEVSLGGEPPQIMADRGSETVGSDEVKRTNLQPQVDAEEQPAVQNSDQISAIDAEIEQLDSALPQDDKPNDKISDFRKLWNQLKKKWDYLKTKKEPPSRESGLGTTMGDSAYRKMMHNHPNMIPFSKNNVPHGPGIFGQE